MILLCPGQRSAKAFDAVLLFASQLDARGHSVAIEARFVPQGIHKNQKFEAAPYLCDFDDINPERLVIIGAEEISDEVQILLRGLDLAEDVVISALGRFTTRMDHVTAQNRLAYAVGREPEVFDLATQQTRPLITDATVPLSAELRDHPAQHSGRDAQVFVYIPHEMLETPGVLPDLSALNHAAGIDLHVITNANGKDSIAGSRYASLSVFGYGELPPATLVSFADIVVFYGTGIPGERMAQFAVQAMGAGKVVIDSTEGASFVTLGAPVLDGPTDLRSLSAFLGDTVVQNRAEIGRRIQQSEWLKEFDIAALEAQIGLSPAPAKASTRPAQTVFFPTNGNGLGHAQRCALIAEEMPADHPVAFTAFPSCVGMLQGRGFDTTPMVQRSPAHPESYAHDLVNFLRLRSVLRAGDQLVFDGGYVFDSVYRTIAALQLPSVWIRRGLWQPEQVHPTALERERVFSRVIVPTEAFGELNTDYSHGAHIHRVGPIVNVKPQKAAAKKALRAALAKQFGRTFDHLVVSMLGGGVASERSAQLQMISAMLDQRPGCLHLVVVWPNAVVPTGIYGWQNTEVVRTQNTLALCQAADLTISAAGYNSFHEIMYAQLPAIFIPQAAPYLDDQEKRARAAAERGVAALVLEEEMLLLRREVTAFLDGDRAAQIKAAFKTLDLPERGNQAAAALIQQGAGA